MIRSKDGLTGIDPAFPKDAMRFVKEGALPFSVIEFLQSDRYLVPLVTHVSSNDVLTERLEPIDVDLKRLSQDIRFRLETWRIGRPGDPFDHPLWRTFEEWLRLQIESHITRGSHIVLIDEPRHDGLEPQRRKQ
jgi:hypothetical protein